MEEYSFNGKKFSIQQGYLTRGNKRLHRLIWEHHYGPIPKGFHVHHKDHCKLNNSIENLQLLSHREHLSLHMKTSRARHVWHKSEEGRKILGERSKKTWAIRAEKVLVCPECNQEFKTKRPDRAIYCSNRCNLSARRKRGVDIVDRQCVICSKTFKVNKHYKTKTCGYDCGGVLSHKKFH